MQSRGHYSPLWFTNISVHTNGDVTRVHCATTLETGTSDALTTLGTIHRCLESSCVEVTFSTIYLRAESPPSDPALPWPRLGQSSTVWPTSPTKNVKVYHRYLHKAKVRCCSLQRVMLWLEISVAFGPHPQQILTSILSFKSPLKFSDWSIFFKIYLS
jgi:hypothetical protein